jgi:hypothetical protein
MWVKADALVVAPSDYVGRPLSEYATSFSLRDVASLQLEPPNDYSAGCITVFLRGGISIPPLWFWKKPESENSAKEEETEEAGESASLLDDKDKLQLWEGEHVVAAIQKLCAIQR